MQPMSAIFHLIIFPFGRRIVLVVVAASVFVLLRAGALITCQFREPGFLSGRRRSFRPALVYHDASGASGKPWSSPRSYLAFFSCRLRGSIILSSLIRQRRS